MIACRVRAGGKNKRKSDGKDGGKGKKGKLSAEEDEMLKKRAERFGKKPVDSAEEEKRKARAARFGA